MGEVYIENLTGWNIVADDMGNVCESTFGECEYDSDIINVNFVSCLDELEE